MMGALWNWHEQPRLVAFVQTTSGRLLLWFAAVCLLLKHHSPVPAILAVSLVMILPGRKRSLLAVASLAVIIRGLVPESDPNWILVIAKSAMVLLCLYLSFLAVRHMKLWPAFVRKRPVLWLHAGIWVALALSLVPALGVLTQVPFLAWRLSYMFRFASRGLFPDTRFRDHLMYLMPAWGGHSSPVGKGLDYLSRFEANDPEAMARSQLAGIKLLVLALIWGLCFDWLTQDFLNTSNGIPSLRKALESDLQQPWYLAWAIIYVELVRVVLVVCIGSHMFVGALRLFGFNVFRNTYKPLLSESIVDFWGRFYFYFKEVLVDFFFYPVYLRLRRWKPFWRLAAAVFAAAFLGNMYYHVLFYDGQTIFRGDWEVLWARWNTRMVYCFLLASGIWISMLRQQRRRVDDAASTHWVIRARRIAGVLTFYAVIRIWNNWSLETDSADAFGFFFSLFGL